MNYIKQLYNFDKMVAGKLTYTHAHMLTHKRIVHYTFYVRLNTVKYSMIIDQ